MKTALVEPLIRQIHDSAVQLVLSATGGGSGAIAALLAVPGASRTVVEAVIPYSAGALTDWLRARPEQFCSDRTARSMAMAGFVRGQSLGYDAGQIVGIGCTASLASDRPKQGEHRIHLARQSRQTTASLTLVLEKGRRTRGAEEDLATGLLLNLTAEACGLPADAHLPLDLCPAKRSSRPGTMPRPHGKSSGRAASRL